MIILVPLHNHSFGFRFLNNIITAPTLTVRICGDSPERLIEFKKTVITCNCNPFSSPKLRKQQNLRYNKFVRHLVTIVSFFIQFIQSPVSHDMLETMCSNIAVNHDGISVLKGVIGRKIKKVWIKKEALCIKVQWTFGHWRSC